MSNQLYREQFMEIFKSNANFGKMDSPTVSSEQSNTFCGDKLTLELKILNNVIIDAKFTGVACAVSKTAASIVTEDLKNKKVTDAKLLTEQDVLNLIQFDLTSSRKQCALLCFSALQKALVEYENHKG
jgi:NifU-like protein involved in Fe-S cluster formation